MNKNKDKSKDIPAEGGFEGAIVGVLVTGELNSSKLHVDLTKPRR